MSRKPETLVDLKGFQYYSPLGRQEEARQREVDQSSEQSPVPELAGLAEVAAILGVSKQRVRELAEKDETFPLPVAELSGGAIYLKAMIEEFNRRWSRRPGRPGKYQTQVSAELAHIPKDRGNLGQQIFRMIYNSLRAHDLKIDPLTPRGQTFFRAVKLAQKDNAGFQPRYDRSFFEPDPPDKRYIELHAECCLSMANWKPSLQAADPSKAATECRPCGAPIQPLRATTQNGR